MYAYILLCICDFVFVYRNIKDNECLHLEKAADIVVKTTSVTPQASTAATMELHNLQSLQLSTLSIDDRGPPHVTYEPQQPVATSTPRAIANSEITTEAYRQILLGMTSRLYPTLVADSSLEAHMSDQQDTLQMQLTTKIDKYLQESAEKREMNVNYFYGQHVATNTVDHQQIDDVAEIGKDNIPELVDNDTGEMCDNNTE